mgnify:FL=1
MKVTVPDDYTGDVMGDLNKRRGRVLGMTPVSGGKQIIEADIPMTGLFGYCTVLRSMTGGRVLMSISLQDMSRHLRMYRRRKSQQEQRKKNRIEN